MVFWPVCFNDMGQVTNVSICGEECTRCYDALF